MNQPSQQVPVAKQWEFPLFGMFCLFLFPAGMAGIIVGARDNWTTPGTLGGIVVFATIPTLAVMIIRFAQRRARKELPFMYAALVVVVAFGGAVAGLAPIHVALVQRCIDTVTYAVVVPNYCANSANSTDILPEFAWYYGGSGSQIGETAGGGSFSSTGDDGGDTGGGTGGEVGDDGGGGEGGEGGGE
jgi:hypothetical protein